jgi:hypothetical protein
VNVFFLILFVIPFRFSFACRIVKKVHQTFDTIHEIRLVVVAIASSASSERNEGNLVFLADMELL